MPDGGRMTITTRNVRIDGAELPTLPPGDYVRITILRPLGMEASGYDVTAVTFDGSPFTAIDYSARAIGAIPIPFTGNQSNFVKNKAGLSPLNFGYRLPKQKVVQMLSASFPQSVTGKLKFERIVDQMYNNGRDDNMSI